MAERARSAVPEALPGERAAGIWAAAIREAVRNERLARGWSLRDAATRSAGQLKESTLGAYERGDRQMTLRVLHQLADLYDVPVVRLIPADPDPGEAGETADRLAHRLATLPDRHRNLLRALVDEFQHPHHASLPAARRRSPP